MPPKEKYKREAIIDAAFELVKEKGFEQLSARNIAAKLGCSTQPIYSSFNSIEELEQEVVERIKKWAQSIILNFEDDESHFLSVGLGYFSFARQEPLLFSSLFVKGRWKWNFSEEDPFFRPILEKMKKDVFLKDLGNEKLAELFRDLFIYTHGLATQSYLSSKPMTIAYARELLRKTGGILIVAANVSGKSEIEQMMKKLHEGI